MSVLERNLKTLTASHPEIDAPAWSAMKPAPDLDIRDSAAGPPTALLGGG
jgi:hypothetical protein